MKISLIPSIYTSNDEVQILCAPSRYKDVKNYLLSQPFDQITCMNGDGTAFVYQFGKEVAKVRGPFADMFELVKDEHGSSKDNDNSSGS